MTDFKDWMSELPKHLHRVPLNRLAIPGSHNSFSYELDVSSEIGPDIKGIIPWFGYIGKLVMKKWSVTQSLTFREQLEHGVRYFDLRVATRKDKSGAHFLHSLYGMSVETGLSEIQSFMEQHPKEIILLDFNHFYQMDVHNHKILIDLITEKFEDKLYPHSNMDNVTLEKMWEFGLQVIVLYQNQVVEDNMKFWPSKSIIAPWPNTSSEHGLITFLDQRYKEKRYKSQFHVVQGILTPGTWTIITHLYSSLHNVVADKVAPRVVMWLKDKCAGPQGINICFIDFVEKADFIPTVLSLNK